MKHKGVRVIIALIGAVTLHSTHLLAQSSREDTSKGDVIKEDAKRDDPIQQGDHLGARSDEYSRVFDKAITCLVRGDAGCFRALLSSVTVTQETRGPGAIDVIIRDKFIPYFKDFERLTDKTGTLPNYDVAGNTGLAICRSFVTTGGGTRYFVLFVNQEGNRYVVGNLLLDTTMEDLVARRKR